MAIQKDFNLKVKYTNDKFLNNKEMQKALKVTGYLENEIVVKDAYIVVSDIYGDKNSLKFFAKIFKDSSKNLLLEVEEYNFKPDDYENSVRWDKQAYQHLKSMPSYFGAVDC